MYHIIANPKAGKGQTDKFLPHLTSLFEKYGLPFSVHITTGVMDGYYLARKFCQEDNDCQGIIGMGGDGTFQEIASGMIDALTSPEGKIAIPLGIFPAGSGNDLALSIEGGKSRARYIRNQFLEDVNLNFFNRIRRNHTRRIDIIKASDKACLNIAHIGLDAKIAENAIELKKKFGRHAYLAAVYKSIIKHRNTKLEIKIDGEILIEDFTLVAICNGQYYGGGMRISPGAKIDDGKITLCLVRALSRPQAMMIFPTLMMEQHKRLKAVSFVECEEVSVKMLDKKEALCLDGNIYPNMSEINFKILPKVLNVFI